jgi:uncharacterized protein
MKNKIAQIDERTVRHNLINLKQIVFEVTEKCNLKCRYCGLSDLYKKYDIRQNRDMPFKKAKLTLDYLLNIWKNNNLSDTVIDVAVSFYGGEPLMNMSLIKEIIEYLEKSKITGRKYHYSMTTNGMLLDKYMDFLAEKKFNLLISMDGDENSHSYRVDKSGNNSFNQVFRNVKLLKLKHPDYFHQSVNFISVLHNRNDIEPIYRFFKSSFDKGSRIVLLATSGVSEDKKQEFQKMYQSKTQSLCKSPNCEAIEAEYFFDTPKGHRLSKYLYHLSGNIFFNYNQLLLTKPFGDDLYTGTCLPFAKKLFVSAIGKILPCERIDHGFALGFVHDDFVELDYGHVAEQHNFYLSKCNYQCTYCATTKLCLQCVYQIDDIRDESPHCQYFCTQEEFDKDNEEIFAFLRKQPHYYDKVLNEISFTLYSNGKTLAYITYRYIFMVEREYWFGLQCKKKHTISILFDKKN